MNKPTALPCLRAQHAQALAARSSDFAAGSATATVKAVRSDWTQYLTHASYASQERDDIRQDYP